MPQPMTWPKFAALVSKHLGHLPTILEKGSRLVASPLYVPKSEAARELSLALDPLFEDLDAIHTLELIDDEKAEQMLTTALAKQYGGDVKATGLLAKTDEIRDCHEKIKPYLEWLRTIG